MNLYSLRQIETRDNRKITSYEHLTNLLYYYFIDHMCQLLKIKILRLILNDDIIHFF